MAKQTPVVTESVLDRQMTFQFHVLVRSMKTYLITAVPRVIRIQRMIK